MAAARKVRPWSQATRNDGIGWCTLHDPGPYFAVLCEPTPLFHPFPAPHTLPHGPSSSSATSSSVWSFDQVAVPSVRPRGSAALRTGCFDSSCKHFSNFACDHLPSLPGNAMNQCATLQTGDEGDSPIISAGNSQLEFDQSMWAQREVLLQTRPRSTAQACLLLVRREVGTRRKGSGSSQNSCPGFR